MTAAKILAVDDEPDFETLLTQRFRRQIRAQEFAFRFAHHGEGALAVLDAEPDIELLLLDINMPVIDGLTLLVHLRERRSPVRAIIVSAYGDMANIRTAMNRGAFDFVTKPVDLNDLEITINKTLEEIARMRAPARRLGACPHQSGALLLAELARDVGGARRALGRGAAPDGGGAVRRHRRLYPHGRAHGAGSGCDDAAAVSRPHDGADLRLRRHGREIYRG